MFVCRSHIFLPLRVPQAERQARLAATAADTLAVQITAHSQQCHEGTCAAGDAARQWQERAAEAEEEAERRREDAEDAAAREQVRNRGESARMKFHTLFLFYLKIIHCTYLFFGVFARLKWFSRLFMSYFSDLYPMCVSSIFSCIVSSASPFSSTISFALANQPFIIQTALDALQQQAADLFAAQRELDDLKRRTNATRDDAAAVRARVTELEKNLTHGTRWQ